MSRKIYIYDTTLRDGAQGEGISFSSADKVRIAERLDAFGIDYIEGGWPGSNPKDMDFFNEHGKEVIYDAEHFFDGYKDDPRYALATLNAAQDSGVDIVVLCDTNGGTMPGEVSRI